MINKLSFLLLLFIAGSVTAWSQNEIKVSTPNGGELFFSGDSAVISFENPDNLIITIEYSSDNGESWNMIAENISGTMYVWKNIPDINSDRCLIKISAGAKYHPVVFNFFQSKPVYNFDGTIFVKAAPEFVEIYDAGEMKLLNTLFLLGLYSFDIHPKDNKLLAFYDSTRFEIREIPSGKLINSKYDSNFLYHAAWSKDATKIGYLTKDSNFVIINADDFSYIKSYKVKYLPYKIIWAPDSRKVAVLSYAGGNGHYIQIWNTVNDSLLYAYAQMNEPSDFLTWSPNSRFILLNSGGYSRLFETTNFQSVGINEGHMYRDYASCWSKDSRFIYIANGDTTITRYDTLWFRKDKVYRNTDGYVKSMSMHPEGKKILIKDRTNTYRIVDSETFGQMDTLINHKYSSEFGLKSAVSDEGSKLATYYWTGQDIYLWSTKNSEDFIGLMHYPLTIRQLVWFNNDSSLAILSDSSLTIKSTLDNHTEAELSLVPWKNTYFQYFQIAKSNDEKHFSVSSNANLLVIDSRTLTVIKKFDITFIRRMEWSYDNDRLICTNDTGVYIYSLNKNDLIYQKKYYRPVHNFVLHPTKDTMYILPKDTASGSLSIKIFDLRYMQEVKTLFPIRDYCEDLSVNKNGEILLTKVYINPNKISVTLAIQHLDTNFRLVSERYYSSYQQFVKWLPDNKRFIYHPSGIPYIDTVKLSMEDYIFDISDSPFTIKKREQPLDSSKIGITIYPNPGDLQLKFEMNYKEKGDYRLRIFDVKGRQVMDYKFTVTELVPNANRKTLIFNTSTLAQATYYVYYYTPDGILNDRFIILR